jgi:16S rRNA (uracil1498-N3)-methyltransferase
MLKRFLHNGLKRDFMPIAPVPLDKKAQSKSVPRLFIDEELHTGRAVHVAGPPAHYLLQVMRAKPGSTVKLFDNRTGEYLAIISGASKRDLTLAIESQLRPREQTPDLWLCQAMIKKDRFDWVAEKSCELGVSLFAPILTSRCVADKLKESRLRAQMIEAAEQCERTALPEIAPLVKLGAMLGDWPTDRTLYFCDERGGAPFASSIAAGPAAILIGPEGGFSDGENEAIRNHPNAIAVSLGPRILRADTAAIAAISVWMACSAASDWNG